MPASPHSTESSPILTYILLPTGLCHIHREPLAHPMDPQLLLCTAMGSLQSTTAASQQSLAQRHCLPWAVLLMTLTRVCADLISAAHIAAGNLFKLTYLFFELLI